MLELFGTLIAFILIIILIRKKFNFGLSLIIGSLIIGIFSIGIVNPSDIIKGFIEATFYKFQGEGIETILTSFSYEKMYYDTIELAILMTLIFLLAKLMQETGAIKKLIDSLRSIFTKGGTLGVVPAVYGLMPVPGGALFSAPTIDEEGSKFGISKNEKNFLNVWFRHIWFSIYPVSSAMILICSTEFSNINIYLLMLVNFPAFIISILIGLYYLKKFVKRTPEQINKKKDSSGLIYLIPPVLPLIFYASLQFINFPQIRSFIIGLIFSIIALFFLVKISYRLYWNLIKKSLTYKLALAIFGIMIFREIFEISKAPNSIAETIGSLPFPPIIIVIIVPIILGVVTGYNLGSVALSYPLIYPFFELSRIDILGLTSLIFISSLVGYLISPIHLCNVLSSEYMKTDTTKMYKMYIPSVFTLLLIQTIFVMILFRY